jgi:hypothetical protein
MIISGRDMRLFQTALAALLLLLAPRAARASDDAGLFFTLDSRFAAFPVFHSYASDNMGCATCFGSPRHAVDPGRTISPRLEAGYRFPGGRDAVTVSGYWIDSTGRDRLDAPGTVLGDLAEVDNDIHTGTSRFSDSVSASNRAQMTEVEAEYSRRFELSPVLSLTGGLGARYASLRDDVNVDFQVDGAPGFSYSENKSSRSNGAGPQVSLTGDWKLSKALTGALSFTGGALFGYNRALETVCKGSSFPQPGCANPFTFEVDQSRMFPFFVVEPSLVYACGPGGRLAGLRAGIGFNFTNYLGMAKKTGIFPQQAPATGHDIVVADQDFTVMAPFLRLQYSF